MWDTVLFDLDGTLLDYSAACRSALDESLSELGLEASGSIREDLLAFLGSGPVQAIEACRPGAPATSDPSLRSIFPLRGSTECSVFLDAFFKALSRQHGLIDGAVETLEAVRPGRRLAAVSNGLGPVQRMRLMNAGLMQYFDALVISCEIGVAKPDPAIFDAALKLLSASKESAVMVGDGAASDMAGAEAAGIGFVYFRPDGVFAPSGRWIARITDLRELPDLPGFREQQPALPAREGT